MHKKMLWVSDKVNRLNQDPNDVPPVQEARRELYQGQCNCAYWHGLFGGLYLNHLRNAVYEHLIKAETISDTLNHPEGTWLDFKLYDLDRDSSPELIISSDTMNLYFKPSYGGSLIEWDYKPASFNLTNVLARRVEAYHRKLKEAENLSQRTNNHEPKSIHDIVSQKEQGLEEFLHYDWYNRYSFLDHLLGSETTLENFKTSRYPELGDFVNQPYRVVQISHTPSREEIRVTLGREGHLWEKDGKRFPVRIIKSFNVRGGSSEVEVVYQITNQNTVTLRLWFGIEFNFNFLSENDPKRYYFFPGRHIADDLLNSTGKEGNVATICLRDEWKNLEVACTFDPPAEVWRFPLETVSRSEEGFERTYQGSSILSHWEMELPGGESKTYRLLLTAGEIKSS
jgi:alpha-amylase